MVAVIASEAISVFGVNDETPDGGRPIRLFLFDGTYSDERIRCRSDCCLSDCFGRRGDLAMTATVGGNVAQVIPCQAL